MAANLLNITRVKTSSADLQEIVGLLQLMINSATYTYNDSYDNPAATKCYHCESEFWWPDNYWRLPNNWHKFEHEERCPVHAAQRRIAALKALFVEFQSGDNNQL